MEKTFSPSQISEKKPSRLLRFIKLTAPLLVTLILVGVLTAWRISSAGTAKLQSQEMPTSAEIEETYGVRFTWLGLVADEGLVDLRYRVIDAGKAKNFGHYTETSPLIIAEDTGQLIEVTSMGLHNHRVEPGRVYYILFRNTANALQHGSTVTIQIGDVRLENVPVN